MHIRTLLAVVLASLCLSPALAAPPPEDVQAILDKMNAGGHPTDAEQARLRAWATQGAGGASADMPDDVKAIMARAKRGVPPTPAERARLKAWAEQGERAKDTTLEHLKTLENAKPVHDQPHGKAASPFIDMQVSVTQTTSGSSPCDDKTKGRSTGKLVMNGTFKVRLKTGTPDGVMSATADVPATGPWALTVESFEPSKISYSGNGYDCQKTGGGGDALSGLLPPTTFVFGLGSRAMVSQVFVQVSPDIALPGSPWRNGPLAALAGVPEYVKAAKGATLVIDGEAIRKMLLARDMKAFGATHHYALAKDGAEQDVTTVFAFAPLGHDEVEVELVYVDKDGKESVDAWKQWIPDPWIDNDAEAKLFGVKKKDEAVLAHVMVKVKGGAKRPLKVSLREVSKHSGMAANYPEAEDRDPDLRLMQPKNGKWTIDDEGQSATLADPVAVAIIDIAALDPAAEGEVHAVTLDADAIEAVEKTKRQRFLALPCDEDDNHIADQWQVNEGVPQGRAAGWDAEDYPALGTQQGDGLGLFEEYRGVIVKKPSEDDAAARWRRLSPKAKKVFVSDQAKEGLSKHAVAVGVPAFARMSNLTVWMVPERYLRMIDGRRHKSWLDWQTPVEMDSHHHTKVMGSRPVVAAIPLSDVNTPDKADFVDKDGPHCTHATTQEAKGTAEGSQMPRAPIDVEVIGLYPFNGQQCMLYRASPTSFPIGAMSIAYLGARGLDDAGYRAYLKKHFVETKRAVMAFTLMHELGHAFGVHHHGFDQKQWHSGNLACPMRYYDSDERWDYPVELGDWDPSKGALVPDSMASAETYTQDDYQPTRGAQWDKDFDRDMHAPKPGWAYRDWQYCRRCLTKMHLWAAEDMPFPTPSE